MTKKLEDLKNLYTTCGRVKIFTGLSEDEIANVLIGSRVVNFKKGKDLFFAEERVSSFYLVLEGVVKLFVINEDGEETILQLLENGDFVNDIFSDDFQTSAKAIKDSKILILNISQVRNFIKTNSQFALNFLDETTKRNAQLVDSMVRLKLTDSKYKVGQFLLGAAFSKGTNKSKNIDLQYDKASLASYLGITPETLSRSLKKLKNDCEIKVEGNKISLVKQSSLCHYCDNKIATKCDAHHSDFCIKK